MKRGPGSFAVTAAVTLAFANIALIAAVVLDNVPPTEPITGWRLFVGFLGAECLGALLYAMWTDPYD